MIYILAHEGRFLETILQDGAGSGVPRTRREPPRREVRTPTAKLLRLARAVAAGSGPTAGSRLRGSASENRHGGAPRGVPVAPGPGGRASQARPKERVRLSALHHPSSGGRNCCCRDGRWRQSPLRLAGGREGAGTCEVTEKPGRSNAPRERTTLRCLTS